MNFGYQSNAAVLPALNLSFNELRIFGVHGARPLESGH
jgi:hypothetical protein